jgi:acyl-CoA hydrolase
VNKVAITKTTTSFIARPADANSIGTIFGGTILNHMDMTAAICARRFCGKRVTTVAVDNTQFFKPLTVGLVVRLEAQIIRTFTTSMKVRVNVFGENTYSGEEYKAAESYFTIVGLNENNKSVKIPVFTPTTDNEKYHWENAGIRKTNREKL